MNMSPREWAVRLTVRDQLRVITLNRVVERALTPPRRRSNSGSRSGNYAPSWHSISRGGRGRAPAPQPGTAAVPGCGAGAGGGFKPDNLRPIAASVIFWKSERRSSSRSVRCGAFGGRQGRPARANAARQPTGSGASGDRRKGCCYNSTAAPRLAAGARSPTDAAGGDRRCDRQDRGHRLARARG
jgi:hypothetical protein